MNESTLQDRIKYLISATRLNKNAFSRLLGISAQSLQNVVGPRKSVPSSDIVIRIVKVINEMEPFQRVNSDWLLLGEGDPFIQTTKKNAPAGPSPESIKLIKEQLAEKDRQISFLLRIIDNMSLGKPKAAKYYASPFESDQQNAL